MLQLRRSRISRTSLCGASVTSCGWRMSRSAGTSAALQEAAAHQRTRAWLVNVIQTTVTGGKMRTWTSSWRKRRRRVGLPLSRRRPRPRRESQVDPFPHPLRQSSVSSPPLLSDRRFGDISQEICTVLVTNIILTKHLFLFTPLQRDK